MKKKNLPWKTPLIMSIITAVIYLVIYLKTKSIPIMDQISYFDYTDAVRKNVIPFKISRIWDIAFIFIFSLLITKCIRWAKNVWPNGGLERAWICLIFSFLIGISLQKSELPMIEVAIILATVFGTFWCLSHYESWLHPEEIGTKLIVGQAICLGYGLGFGIRSGLMLGLSLSLISYIGWASSATIIFFIKYLFSSRSSREYMMKRVKKEVFNKKIAH